MPRSSLFPYTTLFRSDAGKRAGHLPRTRSRTHSSLAESDQITRITRISIVIRVIRSDSASEEWVRDRVRGRRSEEHTSELQSHSDLVCRLLLEKKKK